MPSDDGGASFIPIADGPTWLECSIWDQDCQPGEKCTVVLFENSWSATRCVPVSPHPVAAGEPCQLLGDPGSGFDDCDATSMCWNYDAKTMWGTCEAFCIGSESAPACADACQECRITAEGVLVLCLSTCDPLAGDCGVNAACQYDSMGGFICAPVLPLEERGPARSCASPTQCPDRQGCIPGDAVAGCTADHCCAPFCDLGADTCAQTLPGTTCATFSQQLSPCFAHVGVCTAAAGGA